MTLRSIHNPLFGQFSDAELTQHYIDARAHRKALIERADNGEDLDSQIDDIDSLLFRIDDELCARNLDLPN
jgi:hypothetical protein